MSYNKAEVFGTLVLCFHLCCLYTRTRIHDKGYFYNTALNSVASIRIHFSKRKNLEQINSPDLLLDSLLDFVDRQRDKTIHWNSVHFFLFGRVYSNRGFLSFGLC
jgi:hypothetical protein